MGWYSGLAWILIVSWNDDLEKVQFKSWLVSYANMLGVLGISTTALSVLLNATESMKLRYSVLDFFQWESLFQVTWKFQCPQHEQIVVAESFPFQKPLTQVVNLSELNILQARAEIEKSATWKFEFWASKRIEGVYRLFVHGFAHRIHVWYIYPHLPKKSTTWNMSIYRTWILRVGVAWVLDHRMHGESATGWQIQGASNLLIFTMAVMQKRRTYEYSNVHICYPPWKVLCVYYMYIWYVLILCMKYTFDAVYTDLKRFQNTCKHGLFRDGWTDSLGTELQSSCWHDSSVSVLVLKHETTSSTRLGWEELHFSWVDWLQNFEGLVTTCHILQKTVIQSSDASDISPKPAEWDAWVSLMFAPCASVLDPDVHVASDGLECWLGSLVYQGIKRIGRAEVFAFVVLKCKKNHGLGAFSGFFPTTSFFKESHTFQMSDKATDIMEKTDQCYVALVHFVGRFHQPEALLPAWPLVLLMLSTMLGVWKPGGFEHDFSGTSWEGFKDDCDTMKFIRNQIWRTKSIKFSRL